MRLPDQTGAGYAHAFAPGLLDPARAAPATLVAAHGKATGRRYDVYRNNVVVSLIETLAAIYPAVRRITGPDFFRAMARFHLRETPPTSPLLFEYGQGFPAFIETYEHAADMPWLADVARIERAWLDAYHAAEAPPLALADLARLPPDGLAQLVLEAHPATRLVRSPYPAVTVFALNRGDGPVGVVDAAGPEVALVTRPSGEVVMRRLSEADGLFVAALIGRAPLQVAAGQACAAAPDFDIARALAGAIEAGAFAAPQGE